MKKKVDLYYCFPIANSWEIYFNTAFHSADVLLGLELSISGQIEELFDQIGHCIWMIKLDIVFEWSNWTMYLNDQIGHCIWMIKLDNVFEWSNWTMYLNDQIGHCIWMIKLDNVFFYPCRYSGTQFYHTRAISC